MKCCSLLPAAIGVLRNIHNFQSKIIFQFQVWGAPVPGNATLGV